MSKIKNTASTQWIIVRRYGVTVSFACGRLSTALNNISTSSYANFLSMHIQQLLKNNKTLVYSFVVLISVHWIFYLNKTYHTYSGDNFKREQYQEYIHGFSANGQRAMIARETKISYFNTLPEWSINIIYLGYICLLTWAVNQYFLSIRSAKELLMLIEDEDQNATQKLKEKIKRFNDYRITISIICIMIGASLFSDAVKDVFQDREYNISGDLTVLICILIIIGLYLIELRMKKKLKELLPVK